MFSFSRPYDELTFERTDGTSNSNAVQTLTLTNVGDKLLTFKIKTTSPEKFRVKPGCSLLHSGASINISVSLLKGKEKVELVISQRNSSNIFYLADHCTASSQISKEKFLIIWTLLDAEIKSSQLPDFWKTLPNSVLFEHRFDHANENKTRWLLVSCQMFRLKCSFVSNTPTTPPLSVMNENEISTNSFDKIVEKLEHSVSLKKKRFSKKCRHFSLFRLKIRSRNKKVFIKKSEKIFVNFVKCWSFCLSWLFCYLFEKFSNLFYLQVNRKRNFDSFG